MTFRQHRQVRAFAHPACALRGLLLATSMLAGFTGPALAGPLPAGGVVAAGAATVVTGPTTLTVTQTTPRAVINWTSFGIDPGNKVTFNQPDANSAVLNRVTGASTSTLSGLLSANGAVFLVNPNGIALTSTGNVQTGGGFVASTLAITDADFMAGTLKFTGSGSSASVTNAGKIYASANKFVALLGGSVANSGSIAVSTGRIGLASGEQVTLDLNGAGFMQVAVPSTVAGTGALVQNSGTIINAGGLVVLQAATVKDVVRNVINMPGTINADSAVTSGGKVLLLGGAGGTVSGTGGIYARATGATGDGGTIETAGQHLGVNLLRTYTTAAGAAGKTGTWTLGSEGFTVAASGGDMTGARVGTALASNNVVIRSTGGTPGDVVVNDAVSWTTGNALTLSSLRDVVINKALTSTGNAAGLSLIADNTGTGTGTVTFGSGIKATFSGTGATAKVYYNPATFGTAIDYSGSFSGAKLIAYQLVNTAAKLQSINSYLSGNFALSRDLDASTIANFVPLGTNGAGTITNGGNGFTGSFDGLGHVIDKLTIVRNTANYVGLFGAVSDLANPSGSIENVGLTNARISGSNYVGALVGSTFAAAGRPGVAISNAYSTGTVTNYGSTGSVGGLIGAAKGGTITNSWSSSVISGAPGSGIGGLLGSGDGTLIAGSRAIGNVIARSSSGVAGQYVGGLVGIIRNGRIDSSYATGNVTSSTAKVTYLGGLAGGAYNGVSNSYATGNISVGDSSQFIGGLIGELDTAGAWTGNYATGTVTTGNSVSNVGGLYGRVNAATIGGYALGTVKVGNTSTNVGGLAGLVTNATIDGAYAKGLVKTGISSNNVGGLAGQTSGGSAQNSYAEGSVTTGLGSFNVGGLVGLGSNSANASLHATGDVIGSSSVGGLFGRLDGNTLGNSYATGNVTQIGDTSAGATQQYDSIGGLVGYSSAILDSNYATGSVNVGMINSSRVMKVGGLVGYSLARINNSHAIGNVTALGAQNVGGLAGYSEGAVQNSYATGAVQGLANVGGLVGTETGSIANSYATGATTATFSGAGGLVGNLGRGGDLLPSGLGISASHAEGTVNGLAHVGGLVGYFFTPIDSSYATGNVGGSNAFVGGQSHIGGLAGGGSNAITNSHASGSVVTSPGSQYVGGLIGFTSPGIATNLISDSYAVGSVIAPNGTYVGGLAGSAQTIQRSYATGNVDVAGAAISVGGLVGYLHAYYKDKGVMNSYATGAVTTGANSSMVGGLVGQSYIGDIFNSHASGAVTAGDNSTQVGGLVGSAPDIYSSYATGNVISGDNSSQIGGLVGILNRTFFNAAMKTSYALGNVTVGQNSDSIGGLVGLLSYPRDTTTGTIVSQVYSAGTITIGPNSTHIGGLIGNIAGYAKITSSYWNAETSGQANMCGGTGPGTTGCSNSAGLTTAQMQDFNAYATTYAGWDFTKIWTPPNQAGQNGQATAHYPGLR